MLFVYNEEEEDKTERKPSRKFDLGDIVLPYTLPVKTTPTSSNWCMASLLEVNEENWTGLIKWDSTKKLKCCH